jgi:hypothetical protein
MSELKKIYLKIYPKSIQAQVQIISTAKAYARAQFSPHPIATRMHWQNCQGKTLC